MKLLEEKREEDRRRSEELHSENQAITDKNQTLRDTITSMTEAMERRDSQMLALQKRFPFTVLANPPPPSPPEEKEDGGCVIH